MAPLKTRVLLFDIETSPNIAMIWGKYEQNALGDFVKERQMISFAWKWFGEKKVHVLALPDFDGYNKDPDNNKKLVKSLYELICKADIVVGHNVDGFDDKMANVEFITHGFKPPPPHLSIDTLKVARSRFRFNSNKLGDLGQRLGLGKKAETGGFSLWMGCLRGDKKAWIKMKKYNKQDVSLLELVYLALRPWMKRHPDMNAKDGCSACSACKSINLISRGWSIVGGGRKKRFQCKDCGKWNLGRFVKHKSSWKFR